jgi:hypothetical protein
MRNPLAALACVVLAFVPVSAQEDVDKEMAWRIRREATDRSQVMQTLHMLTDVHGPRLTGSPQIRAASDWAVQQLTSWGLANARLEPWDFGHPGWVNERFSGFIVSPVKDTLTAEVVAWTPGTEGTVTGVAVLVTPPDRPTAEELTSWADSLKGQLGGKVVLVGKPAAVAVSFNPSAKRREDAEIRAQYDPVNPAPSPFERMNQPQAQPEGPKRLTANEISERIDAFLVTEKALVKVSDAGRDHGQIRAFNNRTFDLAKAVPSVVLRNEDYGRIARLLGDKRDVVLEFNIVNRTFPEGRTQHNVVAEIPGTDKADEIVMLGGHIDSWHSATGATDNATGCAIMMEAVRVLQALGVKPRRTIRLALWGGEEQGLLGSQAYVKEHFGTFEAPKPEYSQLVAYFNIDMGTGRPRGLSAFGPPEAAAVLRAAVAPYEDLGVFGATGSKSRRLGGSDHTSFNVAGLAGIGVQQDPIEYMTHTWHTNLDAYERAVPEDLVKAAIVVAGAVFHVAMRDEALPRFTKEQMPAPSRPEGEEAPTRPAPAAAPSGGRPSPPGVR